MDLVKTSFVFRNDIFMDCKLWKEKSIYNINIYIFLNQIHIKKMTKIVNAILLLRNSLSFL